MAPYWFSAKAEMRTGEDIGQHGLLVAHDAAGLDVHDDGAAGKLLQLSLEGQGYVADDGTFDGIDFRIGQGDGSLGQRGSAGKQHDQYQGDAKQLLHLDIPP